ncbi:hypothetical protein AGR4C_Lc120054 [Agrobacterium tumefaciens str. Kerr 14]|uniref:Uncharacterized protein n=1 Tax=Agrobacterium tumefaciens str. Kerr 14 TaxID=1183424 RepID=A0A1S7R7G6_AGRTU|nr:hypothetical protein AGR4C_Lc120054 [Agrobacterium tumefaciens str. Kerr 14]
MDWNPPSHQNALRFKPVRKAGCGFIADEDETASFTLGVSIAVGWTPPNRKPLSLN